MASVARLYADWCASHGYDDGDTGPAQLDMFAAECPAAASTARRRLLSVLAATGRPAPCQPSPAPSPASERHGDPWWSVDEALAALPHSLRGIRDGFLLAVLDSGLTVNRARELRETVIQLLPYPEVSGISMPARDDPASCRRCATTKWLRVIEPAARGARLETREILGHSDPRVHDCWTGLGEWRGAPQLVPAIDRHGWLSARPLSRRSVFTILNSRLTRVDTVAAVRPTPAARGRFADCSVNDLARAYDAVDADLDALLTRTSAVLGDGNALAERLTELGL